MSNGTAPKPASRVTTSQRAILALAFIIVFAPGIALAQPVVIRDDPYTAVMSNPCVAGEVVNVTGRQVTTVYTRFDATAGFHFTFRVITKAKGTVVASPFEPPKDYVLNDESIFEQNLPSSGTYEETSILNHIFIRKSETDGTTPLLGTGEDFMMKQTFHLTISNGVPRADIANGQTRCM